MLIGCALAAGCGPPGDAAGGAAGDARAGNDARAGASGRPVHAAGSGAERAARPAGPAQLDWGADQATELAVLALEAGDLEAARRQIAAISGRE